MSFEPRDYLRHILVEANYLVENSSALSSDEFHGDDTLKRAFVRSIEIIGEAAKKVPLSFRSQHPAVEWKAIVGMRDRLVHDYMGVDYDLVWDVVKNHVPKLRSQVAAILTD